MRSLDPTVRLLSAAKFCSFLYFPGGDPPYMRSKTIESIHNSWKRSCNLIFSTDFTSTRYLRSRLTLAGLHPTTSSSRSCLVACRHFHTQVSFILSLNTELTHLKFPKVAHILAESFLAPGPRIFPG